MPHRPQRYRLLFPVPDPHLKPWENRALLCSINAWHGSLDLACPLSFFSVSLRTMEPKCFHLLDVPALPSDTLPRQTMPLSLSLFCRQTATMKSGISKTQRRLLLFLSKTLLPILRCVYILCWIASPLAFVPAHIHPFVGIVDCIDRAALCGCLWCSNPNGTTSVFVWMLHRQHENFP